MPSVAPVESVDRPIDGRHQRRQQRRLARIEVAVVLDHVDRVPVRLLDHLVDGIGAPSTRMSSSTSARTVAPAAAVVGAEERPPQVGPAAATVLRRGEFRRIASPESPALAASAASVPARGLLSRCRSSPALSTRVDGEDPAQHHARARARSAASRRCGGARLCGSRRRSVGHDRLPRGGSIDGFAAACVREIE